MWVRSLGWEDSLEKEMATYFSIPAWKIPCTEERSRLQLMSTQSQDSTEQLIHTHLLLNFVFENFMFLGSENNYLIESDILRRPTEPSFPQEEVLNFRFGAWCLVCNRFSSEERKERKSKRLAQRNSRKLIWVQSSRKRFLRRWPKHISPNITRA